jgi:hypothetical protein
MNWTVIWLDGPLNQLAAATASTWGTPANDAIVRTMARVERRLEADPMQVGESRAGHRRIVIEPPLTVEFEVHDDQRTVIVTRVRYTPVR